MKQNSTLIALVLDRSGSMYGVREETMSAVNAYLDEQRKQGGECQIVFTQFNDRVQVERVAELHDFPVLGSPALPYEPHGWTALYDAVGTTIDLVARQKIGRAHV